MKAEGQEEKQPVEAELRSVEAKMCMKRNSRGGCEPGSVMSLSYRSEIIKI